MISGVSSDVACVMWAALERFKWSDMKSVCAFPSACWWPQHWSPSKPWSLLVAWRWGDRGVKRLSSDYSSFSVFHRLSSRHNSSSLLLSTTLLCLSFFSCWTLDRLYTTALNLSSIPHGSICLFPNVPHELFRTVWLHIKMNTQNAENVLLQLFR